MKKILLLTFLLTSLFGQTIDTDKSYVKIKVRNMGIRDVSGTESVVHYNNLAQSHDTLHLPQDARIRKRGRPRTVR